MSDLRTALVEASKAGIEEAIEWLKREKQHKPVEEHTWDGAVSELESLLSYMKATL